MGMKLGATINKKYEIKSMPLLFTTGVTPWDFLSSRERYKRSRRKAAQPARVLILWNCFAILRIWGFLSKKGW